MPKRKKAVSPTPLLDSLCAEQAQQVLYLLVRGDPAIAARAEGLARALLGAVHVEGVADSLAEDLSGPAIEDVWDTSGRTRDRGYVYPSERAWEMMDDVVAPYQDEMMAYLRRGMAEQSRLYCAGILIGLRRFQQDSDSALLDEVPDYCGETIDTVREEWESAVADAGQVKLLARFLEEKGLL